MHSWRLQRRTWWRGCQSQDGQQPAPTTPLALVFNQTWGHLLQKQKKETSSNCAHKQRNDGGSASQFYQAMSLQLPGISDLLGSGLLSWKKTTLGPKWYSTGVKFCTFLVWSTNPLKPLSTPRVWVTPGTTGPKQHCILSHHNKSLDASWCLLSTVEELPIKKEEFYINGVWKTLSNPKECNSMTW